ncbi:small multi-drug export protein [bacterium]|nr:small multi-drug export protein [bacterium]MBU4310473.1 small multi-drug export protein [bacterium]MBU4561305.1 small multi-drug export protein [bacterium]MCG2676801.1 small multi-drug export protein [bacterium]MCG2678138.1 small multi-drug export protein [bacterium]
MISHLKEVFYNHPYWVFAILHMTLGRGVSIVYGVLRGMNVLYFLPLGVFFDMFQVWPLYFLYETAESRMPLIRKLKEKMSKRENKFLHSKIFKGVKSLGHLGVAVVALLPVKGCGMWSSILLAHILKIKRPRAYLLFFIGSIIGCLLWFAIGDIIKSIWHQIIH